MTKQDQAGVKPEDMGWLSGGGEMGQLIRAMDWSATPLGPVEGWPQSLRTSVSLCLSSTFPILIAWGPDDVQIYNDAYRPICGVKHPESMGQPFKICWATALPVVGDKFDRAHTGEGTYIRDQRMILDRYGYLEEAFMTFSFSPIRAESGEVGGVFHPITESTGQVLNGRRTQSLRALSERIARSRSIEELAALMAPDSDTLALDVPFMLLYELAADGTSLQLRGRVGLPDDSPLAPAQVVVNNAVDDAVDNAAGWNFAAVLAAGGTATVTELAARFGAFVCGPYEEPPTTALVLPVVVAGQEQPYGFVVAGVSAYRALDDDYRNFYALLGGAFSTAVGNVLAHEQEQRRVAALAAIDQAKTAFFSNVSHEFRTPLTLILGPLEDALADAVEPLGPRQRNRIDVTNRNALRLLKLVNSLLDFSRIEAGRVQARFAPTDLAGLTADLASVFRAAMDKAGLAYHVDVEPLREAVHIDHDMWEKIVFNLLSNAFKFTLSGAVSVRLRQQDDGVELTVRDTGSGIPASELPKVFERFHRVEGVQGRSYEGTGIGLALIQELVRLHGGAIDVRSTVGEGTEFRVAIPFGAAHLPPESVVALAGNAPSQRMGAAFVEEALRWLPDEPHVPAPLAAVRTEALGGPRPRLLVVDDNNDMRAYVRTLLEHDYDVDTAPDGEAALAAILLAPPDLVLSDVMMPRLDGFGLLRKIRTHEAIKDVPVILLSARAGEEAKIEGLQAGADDYLVKPFSANELLARVRSQVEQGRKRQLASVALQQREAYFRALVDMSPAMFWTTDGAGLCTYLSKRWYEYTGRAPHQDLGLGWMECIHPEDADRAAENYLDAVARRALYSVDFRLKGRDGNYRWVIDSGAPRYHADGTLAGYVGTVIDVHERRRLQDRFAHVARVSGIGVWYGDAPLAAMQVNAQLRTQFALAAPGQHHEPLALVQFLAAVHGDDRAQVAAELSSAMHEGRAYDAEFRTVAGDRWIRMIAWCQQGEDGSVAHCDGVTLDVSAQKQGEGELRGMADELAQANERQREFLVTLAHELRNPLAPIRSGLEMLRQAHRAQADIDGIRAMMERQVHHLVHLVDDLLDLARIARGKEVLQPAAVRLDDVLRGAVEICDPLIVAKGQRLTVTQPPAPPALWLDAHRIAQVIGNLLNNAAKYTPPGGAIALAAQVQDGQLTVAVTDDGIGIPADALPTIFDMFTQVAGSEGHAQGGLGIGLNLVRRLVELHGGTVEARSAGAGQGSTFTLRLPVTLPAGQDERDVPAFVPMSQPALAEPLRVMVVDDNRDAAETLAALLEFSGHDASTVHDGHAAYAAVLAQRPDVVFLDIGLPGLDGYEVARRLRADPALAGTMLVAVTGWGAEGDRARADAAGFDHHLTKPVAFDAITGVLALAGGTDRPPYPR